MAPPVKTEAEAADELLTTLQELQFTNSTWRAVNGHRFYGPLLRWYVAKSAAHADKSRLVSLGTCYYQMGMYEPWEQYQRQAGLTPARDVEKALRWDGTNGFGRGFEAVSEYLTKHTVFLRKGPLPLLHLISIRTQRKGVDINQIVSLMALQGSDSIFLTRRTLMKPALHCSSASAAGLTVVFAGLLLLSGSKLAHANGYWIPTDYTVTDAPGYPQGSASSNQSEDGGAEGTLTLTSYASFASTDTGNGFLNMQKKNLAWDVSFVSNGTGNPSYGFEMDEAFSISGAVTGSAVAFSDADQISGGAGGANAGYPDPKILPMPVHSYTNEPPANVPYAFSTHLMVSAFAGPDWTGDPTHENKPGPSAADASASHEISITNYM